MNTKQKKTLLGAIVATILVGTIIVVILAVNGNISSTPKDDEAIKKVVKAIGDGLVELEKTDGSKYPGGVYVKVQEQWLDAEDKKTQKGDEKKKVTLKKVTVYGAKQAAFKRTGDDAAKANALRLLVEAINGKVADDVAVIGEEVEFKDGEVDNEGKKKDDYPMFKRVVAELKVKLSDNLVHGDGKVGDPADSTEMYHLVEVTKKE